MPMEIEDQLIGPAGPTGPPGAVQRAVTLLFERRNCAFNSIADQAWTKQFTGTLWSPRFIVANWVSGVALAATGGVYTGAGKTGTIIVPALQIYTDLTAVLTSMDMSVATTKVQNSSTLFTRLDIPNILPALCDMFCYGLVLD